MPLWTPVGFGDRTWSATTATLSTTPGISVTSGAANTKGSWTQVMSTSTVAHDVYAIALFLTNVSVAATNTNGVIDVGIDPGGGSNYTVVIPDLIVGEAATLAGAGGGGKYYYFPLFIRRGSSIAVRHSNATASRTVSVDLQVYGRPREPSMVWAGKLVSSFGISGVNGQTITSGTVSEGNWTQIGSATTRVYCFWQFGFEIADTTMSSGNIYFVDIAYGDVSNQNIIFQDVPFVIPNANEALISQGGRYVHSAWMQVGVGNKIYARVQCSGTPDSSLSVAVYGVSK